MGLCNSPQSSPNMKDLSPQDATYHRTIEQKMKTTKKANNHIRKLLLLGSGSSGKSTLFRQLKCVYKNGFGENEKEEIIPIIRRNCVSGIVILLKKSQQLFEMDIKENDDCFIDLAPTKKNETIIGAIENIVSFIKDTFEGYENDPHIQEYMNKNDNDDTIDDYTENKIKTKTDNLYKLGVDIEYIWNLPQIQSTFNKRRTYQYSFPDNMHYFFHQLSTIFSWHYAPITEDIIKCRIRTTGLIHDLYETKEAAFTITDVGGQRNERRKWIHGFEGVTAVIFVAALNHYACVLFEDESKNAMIESIELFYEICNSKWFKKTEMILFLNKDDIFQECVRSDICLSACFSEKNHAIWKKEYVDDTSYNKKDSAPKRYDKYDASSIISNKYKSIHRVHNESESLSFSQDMDSNSNCLTDEEYRKRAAIYPKSNLRYSAKDTYDNKTWKDKSEDEWFTYIYSDYLNFITEQYSSMNLTSHIKRVFKHVTTATDGDNVEKVFWDVQNIVIRSNLSKGGLM